MQCDLRQRAGGRQLKQIVVAINEKGQVVVRVKDADHYLMAMSPDQADSIANLIKRAADASRKGERP